MDARQKQRVWIVGSSLIVRLEKYLRDFRPPGYSFGVDCEVRWFGQSGMRWGQVRSRLSGLDGPDPSFIIIHAAGNDLGSIRRSSLLRQMKDDIIWLRNKFPYTTLIY